MNNIKNNGPLVKKASTFAVLLLSLATSFGQCDKNVTLTCPKTEYLNAEGVVQRTVEEECVIKVSKTEITIAPGDHAKMTGTVTSNVCEWKQPFKVGKTTLEATFKNENGATINGTITIEGKDGKITCVMKDKEKPDRVIKATVSKFEEQK